MRECDFYHQRTKKLMILKVCAIITFVFVLQVHVKCSQMQSLYKMQKLCEDIDEIKKESSLETMGKELEEFYDIFKELCSFLRRTDQML